MSLTPPGYEHSPLAGMDFSWLATDRDGHVGWLVTFGSAVVPPWLEVMAEVMDPEAAMVSLPVRQEPVARAHALEREWLEAARRGIFAYDWGVYRGPIGSSRLRWLLSRWTRSRAPWRGWLDSRGFQRGASGNVRRSTSRT